MPRTRLVPLLALLLVLAGCLGGPSPGSEPTDTTAAPTTDATATPTTASPPAETTRATPTTDDSPPGERAIDAEKRRIENRTADWANVTDLSFGILEPAEYEVIADNASGVYVRVTVGYSIELDCDGDGTPEQSADGANTHARYVVTENETRLLAVIQGVYTGYC